MVTGDQITILLLRYVRGEDFHETYSCIPGNSGSFSLASSRWYAARAIPEFANDPPAESDCRGHFFLDQIFGQSYSGDSMDRGDGFIGLREP